MTHLSPARSGFSATELALLSEKEALARLDLLAEVSRILEAAVDDDHDAIAGVAEACVDEFADLCAIEMLGAAGRAEVRAYRFKPRSGLSAPGAWQPVGARVAPGGEPVLSYPGLDNGSSARVVRERIGAESLLVVPVVSSGVTTGWLVAATGPHRRGFRPSALKVAADVASRLGTTAQRVRLHREMQAHARDQARTVTRLRRLASAAANLAGAASPEAVLEMACRDVCVIHEASGAAARWYRADGSRVDARAGDVDEDTVEAAFEAGSTDRVGRGRHWVAYPLAGADPWERGVLAVFLEGELAGEEEPLLSSLASLVPVAFQRAVGTENIVKHEARLRAVIDASPAFMLEIDALGNVSMANRTAQDVFGWRGPPEGWKLEEPYRHHLTDLAIDAVRGGSVVNRPVSVGDRQFSVSAAPLPALAASDAPSSLLAGVDLTEMRRVESALAQAQRLDAMGQVAGRVAHDFNNLLTLIIGYAAILRRGIGDDKQLGLIGNIEDAAKRAASLTQQMLDMTRQKVDSGVVIDLGRSVAGLDAVLERIAGPTVDLRIRTSRNVIKVRLDPGEMEQIVVNLVINACDAMDRVGRIDVGVRLVAPTAEEARRLELPAGPLALLTVSDSGPGMAPEVLARCLEPFYTTKSRGRGSGLGLPTVYGLVKERGGQMTIDSTPGKGTRIRIWLPLVRDAALTAGAGGVERWPDGKMIQGRVLLVEDEAAVRPMAEYTLTSIGLEVQSYPSAEEALEAFRSDDRFDALVTDILLPGMSGVELASAVREIRKDMPVVYMTGYTASSDAPARGDPVIRKPYEPDVLRLRVAEMVQVGRVRARRR
jgi:signal transduction histidine kinase